MSSFLDMGIKEEYRSSEDDIIKDFFIPCYSRCVEYDRCIEYVSIDMLKTVFNTYDNFSKGDAKLRILTSYRFRPVDLDVLTILLSKSRNPFEKRGIKDGQLRQVRMAFERGQIELKIAVSSNPTAEETFTDKIGIFRDMHGHAIAYTSTARSSFATKKGLSESIDVYTSWGDATRVEKKMATFEKLWCNKMPYTDVYEFEYAAKNGYLKYWTEWIMHE